MPYILYHPEWGYLRKPRTFSGQPGDVAEWQKQRKGAHRFPDMDTLKAHLKRGWVWRREGVKFKPIKVRL